MSNSHLFGATIGNLSYWADPSVQSGLGGTQLVLGAMNSVRPQGFYYFAAPTVGELITVPSTDSFLNSVTVTMPAAVSASFAMNFVVAVYQWDQIGFRPVGSPVAMIQASNPMLNGPTQYLNNFDSLTVFPNVQLSGGGQYVMLFSTLGMTQSTPFAYTSFGVTRTDTYSGGEMVFTSAGIFNETSTPLVTIENERWGNSQSCDQLALSSLCTPASSYFSAFGDNVAPDLAFSAEFTSPVPEPRDLALLGLGLIALLSKRGSQTLEPLGRPN